MGTKNVPLGSGPKKNLGKALKELADNVSSKSSGENLLINPNFPKIGYKLAGEIGWWLEARSNGLRRRDLSLRKQQCEKPIIHGK